MFSEQKFDICHHFNSHFRLIFANTPKLLDEVFKLRFGVYCQELQYESEDQFPRKLERDIYDSRSIHCLLMHKEKGDYIGCVRLVLPDDSNPHSIFPVEKVCQQGLSLDLSTQSRSKFCEVSRLAVPAAFRKCHGREKLSSGLSLSGDKATQSLNERFRFPVIALSLYIACASVMVNFGLDTIALMEKRLARHLSRCGCPARQVSDLVEFRGRRAAFLISRESILSNLKSNVVKSEFKLLFEMLHSQLSDQLRDYLTGQLVMFKQQFLNSPDPLQDIRRFPLEKRVA